MWDEITDLQQDGQEILYSLSTSMADVESRDEVGEKVLT
jgi:hypothetical protein